MKAIMQSVAHDLPSPSGSFHPPLYSNTQQICCYFTVQGHTSLATENTLCGIPFGSL